MWMMPLHQNVNQKSDYDMMMTFFVDDQLASDESLLIYYESVPLGLTGNHKFIK